MDEERYYIGTDLKFAITLTATGFDQSEDDYVVDIYSGKSKITLTVANGGIKYNETTGDYYLLVPTEQLRPGTLRMVVTAYVPDSDFPGEEGHEGTRREVVAQDIAYISNVR